MAESWVGAVPLWDRGTWVPNTMWPGLRPTCVPSFILIHPNVWPRYTNVTDVTGQTDRQRSDSIGSTVLQTVDRKTVCPMLSDRCRSVCAVCNVGAVQPNGWVDQDETWRAVRRRPWPHFVRWGPPPL